MKSYIKTSSYLLITEVHIQWFPFLIHNAIPTPTTHHVKLS